MQVKILNDEEFEALPYPEMSTSVGVADPRTKTAYVRKTHMPIIDAFTIAHELEHLEDGHEGVHADHFRNGVYYKDFGSTMSSIGNIAGPIMMAIPGMQPFGIATMAGSGAGGMIGQRRQQRQAAGQGGFGNLASSGEGSMGSFQPEVSQPNVIQTGGGGGAGSLGSGMSGSGSSALERVRGFFSGRNPQGAGAF